MEWVYLVLAILIFIYITPYFIFTKELLTMFIPSIVLKFIFLALAISVLQYFINRKDD